MQPFPHPIFITELVVSCRVVYAHYCLLLDTQKSDVLVNENILVVIPLIIYFNLKIKTKLLWFLSLKHRLKPQHQASVFTRQLF